MFLETKWLSSAWAAVTAQRWFSLSLVASKATSAGIFKGACQACASQQTTSPANSISTVAQLTGASGGTFLTSRYKWLYQKTSLRLVSEERGVQLTSIQLLGISIDWVVHTTQHTHAHIARWRRSISGASFL